MSDFGEAAMFALEAPEALEASDEAVAVVDARGRVVRIVVDMLVPDSARMWRPRRPVHERGDESVLHVIIRPHVAEAAPCAPLVLPEPQGRSRGFSRQQCTGRPP